MNPGSGIERAAWSMLGRGPIRRMPARVACRARCSETPIAQGFNSLNP